MASKKCENKKIYHPKNSIRAYVALETVWIVSSEKRQYENWCIDQKCDVLECS